MQSNSKSGSLLKQGGDTGATMNGQCYSPQLTSANSSAKAANLLNLPSRLPKHSQHNRKKDIAKIMKVSSFFNKNAGLPTKLMQNSSSMPSITYTDVSETQIPHQEQQQELEELKMVPDQNQLLSAPTHGDMPIRMSSYGVEKKRKLAASHI